MSESHPTEPRCLGGICNPLRMSHSDEYHHRLLKLGPTGLKGVDASPFPLCCASRSSQQICRFCKIAARSCRRLLPIEEVTNQNLVGGLIANTCL